MNKEDGELPVTPVGLQTIAQTHTDPSPEAADSGTLQMMRHPSLGFSLICTQLTPPTGNLPHTGSHGVFDSRSEARVEEEEGGECTQGGSSPWCSPGRGASDCSGADAFAFIDSGSVCGWFVALRVPCVSM